MEISGFLDGIYAIHPDNGRASNAYLNQVEIDLQRRLGDRAEVCVAVAYDESFGIGAATMSYAFRSVEVEDGEPSPLISNWTASVGQFDVPFGLDYGRYASVDRPSVSEPEVCGATHGNWNDVGLLTTVMTRFGSLDAWTVKGMDSRMWNSTEEIPEDVADDDERWLTVESRASGGARLDVTLIPGLGWGATAARGWAVAGEPAFTLVGLHAQGKWKSFRLQTEAIRAVKAEHVTPTVVRGCYVEAKQTFDPVFAVGRWDYVEEGEVNPLRYYNMGGGVTVTDGLECRTEYRIQSPSHTGQVLFQVVARF
ncbi:hypothetical protein KKH27_11350 [bacterium]|nr:hypothetical protein [bacterium]MBU1984382.1 hypothetical protein [bacterium]